MTDLIGAITTWAGELNSTTIAALDRQGYLPCHGQMLDKGRPGSKYHALWDTIGSRYKYTGENVPEGKFRIPDLQGRGPIGAGSGGSQSGTTLSPRTLGDYIGEEACKLLKVHMPMHDHSSGNHRYLSQITGNDTSKFVDQTGGQLDTVHGRAITPEGNDVPHNNMQPSLVVHFLIRFAGGHYLSEEKEAEK